MNAKPSPQSLLQQAAQIPHLERGKLSVIGQGPNGPYYNHQHREGGRNVSRYIPGEQVPALQEAIAGYEKFHDLIEQYVDQVVEKTRRDIAVDSKKKPDRAPQILLAQDQEIQQLMVGFQAQEVTGLGVQQLEGLVRAAVFKSANELIGLLLQQAAERIDAHYQPKPGQIRKGAETMRVQGMFGSFELTRDYYYHPGKKEGHYPADAALGLEVAYTPALAKLICLEGADEPTYLQAERHLEQTGGIVVSARQIQRVVQRVGGAAQTWQERQAQAGEGGAPIMYVSADGTGVPMVPEELQGRRGQQADGSAKTRQVYLGCVFTQHRTDEKGHPVRDWESTTYVSSFKPIGQFGPCLRQEAIRRGMGGAGQVVVLIDGAVGLEHMGQDCFQDAVQIVDFFHAMEHAGQALAALIGKDHPDYKARLRQWAKRLLKNKVQSLITETRQECAGQPQAEAVEEALGYFVRNVKRMQYGTFRAAGYFIGSGVVEAGCKTVIGGRCKQSGMFWSKPGAENILALRCIHSSRRLEQFWKSRLNERAALNDALALAA